MFRNILVATDFSDSSRAAARAGLSLAKKCLARIQFLHVVSYLEEVYNFSRFGIPDQEWQSTIRKTLEDFFPAELYPNSERYLVTGHSTADEILKFARTHQSDLIVIGSRGRSAITKMLLGSVTHQMSRLSEIPLLIVRDAQHSKSRYQGERVLVPTDFSDAAMKALDLGLKFANFLKADLHLVHVVDLPAMQEFQRNYPVQKTVPESCELNTDSVLQQMLANQQVIGTVKVATLSGEPVAEIIKYAHDNQIDFIVMGTHGRKGMERVLLGSVTAGVAAKGKVPIMTVSYSQ